MKTQVTNDGTAQLLPGEGNPSVNEVSYPNIHNNNNNANYNYNYNNSNPNYNTNKDNFMLDKNKSNSCRPIPGFQRVTLIVIFILGFLEILGLIINDISQGDVIFVVTDTYEVEEYAAIGWNRMSIITSTSNDWVGQRNFVYSDWCGMDDCEFCLVIDWCKLETKGNEWYLGCMIRIGICVVSFVLLLIMCIRAKMNDNKNNNNVSDYDNINDFEISFRTRFYRLNNGLFLLFLLFLLGWCVCGIIFIMLWNNNNPVNDFDSVTWSVSLIFATIESLACGIFFIADLFDYCKQIRK